MSDMTVAERESVRNHLVSVLAGTLGMRELRVGREFSRDEAGRRISQRWIEYVWAAIVQPSFSPCWAISAARTDDGQTRAAIAFQGEGMKVLHLGPVNLVESGDIILDSLNELQLIEPVKGVVLDGIAYSWTVMCGSLSTTLSFCNPRTSGLKQLEDRLAKFVQLVIRVAGEHGAPLAISDWLRQIDKIAV
jgi:hypothetical protein